MTEEPFQSAGDCLKCGRMILWGEAVVAVSEWRNRDYVAYRFPRGDMHISCEPSHGKGTQP